MYVSLASIIVNAALDYMFAVVMNLRTAGLALSTSVVALVNFFLLMAFMRRRIERVEASLLLKSLARIAAASVAMTAAAYATHRLLETHRYVDVAASIAVALIVFGAACKLLRVEEFGELLGVLKFRGS